MGKFLGQGGILKSLGMVLLLTVVALAQNSTQTWWLAGRQASEFARCAGYGLGFAGSLSTRGRREVAG